MGFAFGFEDIGNLALEAPNIISIVDLQSALHKCLVSVVACAPAEPLFASALKQQTERACAPEELTAVACAPEELTAFICVPEAQQQVARAPAEPTEGARTPED